MACQDQYKAIDLAHFQTQASVAMVHDATNGDGTFTAFLGGQEIDQLSGVAASAWRLRRYWNGE